MTSSASELLGSEVMKALVRFLEVEILLVCLPGAPESDLTLSELHASVNSAASGGGQLNRSASFMLEKALDSPASLLDGKLPHQRVLLLCDPSAAANPASDQFYTDRAVWLFEKGATDLHDLPLRLDSDVVSYETNEVTAVTTFTEHYRVKQGDVHSVEIAWWSRAEEELTTTKEGKWDRRVDLGGLNVVDAVLPWVTVTTVEADLEGSNSTGGLTGELLSLMQAKANFTVTVVSPEDGSWGSADEEGNWNGMVGMLVDGEADLSTAGLTVTVERRRAVDFGLGVLEDVTTLLKAKSGGGAAATKVNVNAYVGIFSLETWLVLASIVALVSLAFAVIAKTSWRRPLDGLFYGLALSFQALLQLGATAFGDGQLLSARLAFVAPCLSFFLLFASYTADLTAIMTSGTPRALILSFSDALEKGYDFILWRGVVTQELLETALPGSGMKRVYEQKIVGNNDAYVDSEAEALERIHADPKLLYFSSWMSFMGDAAVEYFPNLDDGVRSQLAFAYRPDSELRPLLDFLLLGAVQAGQLRKLRRRFLEDDRQPGLEHRIFVEEVPPLGFDNLFLPAAVLTLGAVIGAGFAFVEYLRESLRPRHVEM